MSNPCVQSKNSSQLIHLSVVVQDYQKTLDTWPHTQAMESMSTMCAHAELYHSSYEVGHQITPSFCSHSGPLCHIFLNLLWPHQTKSLPTSGIECETDRKARLHSLKLIVVFSPCLHKVTFAPH